MNNLLNIKTISTIVLNIAIILGIATYVTDKEAAEINARWDKIEAAATELASFDPKISIELMPTAQAAEVTPVIIAPSPSPDEVTGWRNELNGAEAIQQLLDQKTSRQVRAMFKELDYIPEVN